MASTSSVLENESGEPSRENSSDEGLSLLLWREMRECEVAFVSLACRHGGCQRARNGESGWRR